MLGPPGKSFISVHRFHLFLSYLIVHKGSLLVRVLIYHFFPTFNTELILSRAPIMLLSWVLSKESSQYWTLKIISMPSHNHSSCAHLTAS